MLVIYCLGFTIMMGLAYFGYLEIMIFGDFVGYVMMACGIGFGAFFFGNGNICILNPAPKQSVSQACTQRV